MTKIRKSGALALLLLGLTVLGACSAQPRKTPMTAKVVNRTTYPIADIRISPASSDDWGPSRIDTVLQEGEERELDLGSFTEEELNSGFNVQIYGEDDEPISPDHDPSGAIFFDNGEYLIFAPPDTGWFLFIDVLYDEEKYDQTFEEYYAIDEASREAQ
mgnify:CR=1 FL=1